MPGKEQLFGGAEFEFYLDVNSNVAFHATLHQLEEDLGSHFSHDIYTDVTGSYEKHDEHLTQIVIKTDHTLDTTNYGIEVCTPKCSIEELREHIDHILPIIQKYAFTDSSTGLHLHISVPDRILRQKMDFYLFMLIANDQGLLSSWEERSEYSRNVKHVLDCMGRKAAKRYKKGREWNVLKVEDNHIEIRTMGGKEYQNQQEQILHELDLYIDVFLSSCSDTRENAIYHQKLLDGHKQLIDSASDLCLDEMERLFKQMGLGN